MKMIIFILGCVEGIIYMKRNELFSAYYNELTCKIYILGCENEGESILFILCGDKRIIYSCIIDSFSYKNDVALKKTIEKCGIKRITDLFWTHPHDDHSDGIIDIIENHKPDNVYIPVDLHQLPNTVGSVSKQTLDKLNTYRGYDKRHKYQPKVTGIGNNTLIKRYDLQVDTKIIHFEMYGVAPCAGRVRRKAIQHCADTLNDYSLAISVVIGDFAIFLTGDIQNEMIQISREDSMIHIPKPNVMKIPHHGSKYSTQVMSMFDEGIIDYGITTRKKTSKLPKKEVLDYYREYMKNLYLVDETSSDIAIWGIEVDILNNEVHQLECKNFILFN